MPLQSMAEMEKWATDYDDYEAGILIIALLMLCYDFSFVSVVDEPPRPILMSQTASFLSSLASADRRRSSDDSTIRIDRY